MKKLIPYSLALIITIGLISLSFGEQMVLKSKFAQFKKKNAPQYLDGDIIFQSSEYGQSKAIQLATKSRYSHVGMIFHQNEKAFVLEAVQPVTVTLLSDWVTHGTNNHFVVKRLKNRDEILTETVLQKMQKMGNNWVGKDYDLYFGWSDDLIYCSELVWKIYHQNTGLKIGQLQKLKDFDLSHPLVKNIMKERYGNDIPWDEETISPGAMFESELLVEVYSEGKL
ncbi:MAG: hypothetical protein ACI9G9_000278 [Psychromonas sp.]|jgi:hypothetical protein